jgi:DUF4097 and DUF4098 domain-containing protein YvlB
MKALALLLATLATTVAAQTTVDQRRPAAHDGVVEIENMAGSIHVTGWDKAEILVSGKLGHGATGVEFSGPPSRTHIEVDSDTNPMGVHSDLDIKVPAGSSLRIEGFEASITIVGVTGSVTAETVNGAISLTGGSKEIDLQVVNGGVDVVKASGHIKAESVNGAVNVRESSGELDATTVNGAVTASGGPWQRVHLETTSGGVRFEGSLSKAGVLEAETVSGSADLLLPAAIVASFSVSSFSGDIENEFGPAASRQSRWTKEKELSFNTGEGGASINVQTLSGNVALRKQR